MNYLANATQKLPNIENQYPVKYFTSLTSLINKLIKK